MNDCEFLGRLGKDIEIKSTTTGKTYARFSLATNRKVNEKEFTTWVNVVAWNELANDAATYLHKGSLAFVKGRMETRSYEGKNGEKKTITEVVATHISIPLGMEPKKEKGDYTQFGTAITEMNQEELPF